MSVLSAYLLSAAFTATFREHAAFDTLVLWQRYEIYTLYLCYQHQYDVSKRSNITVSMLITW